MTDHNNAHTNINCVLIRDDELWMRMKMRMSCVLIIDEDEDFNFENENYIRKFKLFFNLKLISLKI